MTTTAERAMAALLDRVLGADGPAVPVTVTDVVHEHLRARRVELHLVDRPQQTLQPAAATPGEPAPRAMAMTESAAGAALLASAVHRHRTRDGAHTLVPVTVRGRALGTLTIVTEVPLPVADAELTRLGELLALLLIEATATTDAIECRRRSHHYSLNAELQWQLLPPTGLAAADFRLHALVEPAPLVTSDLFDWVHNDGRLWLALLDATGRGTAAAQACDLAIAALRNARRTGVPLAEQASLADQAVHDRYRGRTIVRALLVEIDLHAGTAHGIDAGTAVALRRRRGQVDVLPLAAQDPFGFVDRTTYQPQPADLAPADALLLVSDGAVHAVDATGRPVGLPGIADRFARSTDLSTLPRQLIDDLRTHVADQLDEDATVLVVDWRPRRRPSPVS